jgi:ABC-type multidrug transport system fused ATPase/permease subunit
MIKIKGSVFLSGKIAYLPQKFIFFSTTVKDSIKFYNKNINDEKVS